MPRIEQQVGFQFCPQTSLREDDAEVVRAFQARVGELSKATTNFDLKDLKPWFKKRSELLHNMDDLMKLAIDILEDLFFGKVIGMLPSRKKTDFSRKYFGEERRQSSIIQEGYATAKDFLELIGPFLVKQTGNPSVISLSENKLFIQKIARKNMAVISELGVVANNLQDNVAVDKETQIMSTKPDSLLAAIERVHLPEVQKVFIQDQLVELLLPIFIQFLEGLIPKESPKPTQKRWVEIENALRVFFQEANTSIPYTTVKAYFTEYLPELKWMESSKILRMVDIFQKLLSIPPEILLGKTSENLACEYFGISLENDSDGTQLQRYQQLIRRGVLNSSLQPGQSGIDLIRKCFSDSLCFSTPQVTHQNETFTFWPMPFIQKDSELDVFLKQFWRADYQQVMCPALFRFTLGCPATKAVEISNDKNVAQDDSEDEKIRTTMLNVYIDGYVAIVERLLEKHPSLREGR